MEKRVQRLVRVELMFRKKLAALKFARSTRSNARAYKVFEIPKSTFYR
jgi:hypothetical protein